MPWLEIGLIALVALGAVGFYFVGITVGRARNQKAVADWLNREQGRIQQELHDGNKPRDHGDALDRL